MKSAPQHRLAHPITSALPQQHPSPTYLPLPSCCKNAETATLTTFRINTCKSVSKQRTLTPLGINTYEKHRGGGGGQISFASAFTCATWRLYPVCPHPIAHTSRHHRGGPPMVEQRTEHAASWRQRLAGAFAADCSFPSRLC